MLMAAVFVMAQTSLSGMVRHAVVHPYHGTRLSNRHTQEPGGVSRVMLSENSTSSKITCCMIPFMEHSGNDRITERTGSWLPGVRDEGNGEGCVVMEE